MKSIACLFAMAICGTFSLGAWADVLELKNGTVLNGTYAGGSPGIVRFTTASGTQVVEAAQAVSLTFTTANAAGAAAAPASPAPAAMVAPAAAPAVAQQQTLPAGTVLLVRTMDGISSKSKAGTPFTARLETDTAGLKSGTPIYGKIAAQPRRVVLSVNRPWICGRPRSRSMGKRSRLARPGIRRPVRRLVVRLPKAPPPERPLAPSPATQAKALLLARWAGRQCAVKRSACRPARCWNLRSPNR